VNKENGVPDTDGEKPGDAGRRLRQGFLRKFASDVKAVAVGVCVGAGLGLLAGYLVGVPWQSGLKLGALVGAIAGLLYGGATSKFDFGRRDGGKNSKS
jgi:hypothetical protein